MVHLLLAVIYLAFISLGLPDSLLGSAWPIIYKDFDVSVSYAGIVAVIISLCTIASSLLSQRLIKKLGTGLLTAMSALVSAAGLFGFASSRSFIMLCIWALPYGLGAGCVDAALNNYVALNYPSRHMSWLHCMWGVGASIGPYIFGFALAGGAEWNRGYYLIGILQAVLCALIFASLPMWKKAVPPDEKQNTEPIPLGRVLKIRRAKSMMLTLFCYCAVEQTAALWASSYLVLHRNIPSEQAAFFGSLFFTGITTGRALSGVLTIKFSNKQMVMLGSGVIALGIVAMLLPLGDVVCLAGFVLIGAGCAPIYPCLLHSTPEHFGRENSEALIGVQMACASAGACVMPPLFGLAARHISPALLPWYLLITLVLMIFMHHRASKK